MSQVRLHIPFAVLYDDAVDSAVFRERLVRALNGMVGGNFYIDGRTVKVQFGNLRDATLEVISHEPI